MSVYFSFAHSRMAMLIASALVLSACAVGPDYQAPTPSTPGSFNSLQSDSASRPQATAINANWWRSFRDPQLDSLIERAIAGNLSLQQAVLRIAGARQQLNQARGAWAPSVNANARFTRQQLGIKGELESEGVYDRLDQANLDTDLKPALDSLSKPVGLYQEALMPPGNWICGARCAVRLKWPARSSSSR